MSSRSDAWADLGGRLPDDLDQSPRPSEFLDLDATRRGLAECREVLARAIEARRRTA